MCIESGCRVSHLTCGWIQFIVDITYSGFDTVCSGHLQWTVAIVDHFYSVRLMLHIHWINVIDFVFRYC